MNKEITQTIVRNEGLYQVQRIAIHHDGNNLMDTFNGRVLVIDGRTIYKQYRFYEKGKEDMQEFAQRSGFADTNEFFNHYHKLTDGKPFYGIIRYSDGRRWLKDNDIHWPDVASTTEFVMKTAQDIKEEKEGRKLSNRQTLNSLPEEDAQMLLKTIGLLFEHLRETMEKIN